MKTLGTVCGVLLVTAMVCGPAWSDMATVRLGSAPKAGPAEKPVVPGGKPPTAYVPATKAAPTLDGKLDEEVWKSARVLTLARTLDSSSPAAQKTEVLLLRDATTLYVGVRAFEPMLDKLQATRRAHDGSIWEDDSIEIFLGVAGRYYHLGVNAVGSTYDAEGKNGSWNGDIKAAAGRGKSEYVLEVAIGLVKMAGKEPVPVEWTGNFNRNRRVSGALEEFAWSPTYSGDSHVPSRFGQLLLTDQPKEAPGKEPEKPVVKAEALEVLPAASGEGVARFDLSAIPKGAKIIRADLLVFRTAKVDGRMEQALVDIEIYPLFLTFLKGAEAKPEGKPLEVRAPWFDRFDATEAVRQWTSGKTNGGFFFKACPFWNAAATCLDVAYEAKPQDVPPQVSEVKAFHRAGQTFITFKEPRDLVAAEQASWGQLKGILETMDQAGQTRYCVYRHTERITPGNIHQAELLATIEPLSCWNINSRNIDRPVDQYIATADGIMTGHWNPFDVARIDSDFGRDCAIERFVIREGDKPLPSGTGLYVHTPAKAGKAFYAVVAALDGVQNTKDVSDANSLAAPVAEEPGSGEPVLQGELAKMPFFNYPQKRLHYVAWVAPPFANVPSQYYNWSVGVPDEVGKDIPLELNFHRDGHSFWRTHYRIERDSIVLSPHDFPVCTWWYGYHEALGTVKSFRQGVIQPYTERRLLAFIDWACRKWPVDRNRILVTGCRGGASGSGALHLGLRHPEVFNLVISGHGALNYAVEARRTDRGGAGVAQSMQAIWGQPDWEIKAEDGKDFWGAQDMLRLVKETPVKADLPFVTLTSSSGSAHPFYEAMLATRRGLICDFAWGGARYVPVSASGTYPNAIRLDLRRNASYPAIGYAAGIEGIGTNGSMNTQFRWADVVDTPERYEVTLSGDSRQVVVALRRVQKFRVEPEKAYAWENKLIPGAQAPRPREAKPNTLASGGQTGEVKVGQDGLLVIEGVETAPGGSRLIVTTK